jgi:hypothetical protein
MTNYYSLDGTVTVAPCDPGTACTWLGSFYACAAGPMTVDPSGVAPFACGGPPIPLSVSNCSVVCKADADCASMSVTTVCDAASGLCVECLADVHCKNSPKGAFCNPQSDACVACLADADCTGGQGCHPEKKQCFTRCLSNADCTDPASPACDPASGICHACHADADCKDPLAPLCGESKSCVECTTDASCQGKGSGPACDPQLKVCGCHADSDCAASPNGPTCTPGFQTVAVCGCTTDADCQASTQGPRCNPQSRACASCASDFDCKDPAKPACEAGTCAASSQCTGDDASEDKDDGPIGATDITPTSGNKNSVTGHKICGLPASEADYFTFTAANGDSVTLTLSWDDPSRDLDLSVTDAQGFLLGLDFYRNPAVITLDYLPAGAYFLSVRRYDTTPDPVATPYAIDVSRTTGNKCASISDCAKDGASSILRGDCNVGTGACEAIDGKGAVARSGACDSSDDCSSGLCAETLFNQNASRFAFCTIACVADTDCASGQVCTTVFQNNFCTARCTKDSECFVDTNTAPTGTAPWAYLGCNVATGACSP